MQIVWMKGHNTDIVDNVTLEYMYIGPCNCSDQPSLCQRKTLNFGELTNSTTNISNLQEHSKYLFKITASNPAGSHSTVMNVTTLSSSKYKPNLFIFLIDQSLQFSSHWSA